jgi:hypothetical protein
MSGVSAAYEKRMSGTMSRSKQKAVSKCEVQLRISRFKPWSELETDIANARSKERDHHLLRQTPGKAASCAPAAGR